MHVASVQCIKLRNISSNDNNHILKFFTKGFENLPSSFFLNSKNLLSSIEQCTWPHLYLLFGKFHLHIHNKVADNNGTPLPHETDFDISKDHFCWIDVFIRWFEDYQLPHQFVGLLQGRDLFHLQVQLFADLTFHALVSVHLCTFIVLHGYFSLGKTSGPTTKTAGSEVLP